MSLFGIFIVGLILYYLYKHLRAIVHVLFGSNQQPTQQQQTSRQNRQQQPPKPESGNHIIHDDEGEYVDFEEIKD